MNRSESAVVPVIEVEVRGEMPPESAEYARATVLAVACHARERVLSARVRLIQGRDPAVRRSAVARASLDVNGRLARARVVAGTMHEAIDLLRDRLEYRLARLEHWDRWPGGMPGGPYGVPAGAHRGLDVDAAGLGGLVACCAVGSAVGSADPGEGRSALVGGRGARSVGGGLQGERGSSAGTVLDGQRHRPGLDSTVGLRGRRVVDETPTATSTT
ncbi:hypothetical protein BX265_0526 [Streptomyces sp. TLI_235]|nr:hypothetical protein BX265_0526 [Streptomyces sp. TLI_235]